MHARRYASCRLPSRAIFTRPAIHSLTSDWSQPTARGPSGTGLALYVWEAPVLLSDYLTTCGR